MPVDAAAAVSSRDGDRGGVEVSMIRETNGPSALFVVLCLTAGCSQPTAEQPAEHARPPAHEQGEVRIQEASRQFIAVEEVSAATKDSMITAPARVDFRDGAVSQVGAPLDGRVVTVHVLLGQRVSVGSPLVTLDCPDAAALRAAAAVAQSSLREARLDLERQHRMQQEGVGIERELVAKATVDARRTRYHGRGQTSGDQGGLIIAKSNGGGKILMTDGPIPFYHHDLGAPELGVVYERSVCRSGRGRPRYFHGWANSGIRVRFFLLGGG